MAAAALYQHAMYEQSLAPFIGMVAKTVFLPVEEGFTALPPQVRLERVDGMLAAHFADRARFAAPRLMAPMPVLGIPGWHAANANEARLLRPARP